MRRALVLAAFATLAAAAPAQAQEPAPSVIRFTPGQATPFTEQGATVDPTCSGGSVVTSAGGWDGGPFLQTPCRFFIVRFDNPQAMVELFARTPFGNGLRLTACRTVIEGCTEIGTPTTVTSTSAFTPVVLADPAGAATIEYVEGAPVGGLQGYDIDDIAFSTVRQPGTEIVSGPDTLVEGQIGSLVFRSSATPATFQCSVDGGPPAVCSSPLGFAGVGLGSHTISVVATDAYGQADPSPATFTFNVVPAPPAPSDGDRDSVPDAADNCPVTANTSQADGDADAVGDACEVLPAGNVPPVAGVNAVVRQVSGEVFVKLPAPTRLGFHGMRAPFQETGFIPLKGVASVPVGSTVDTRKGEIDIQSAANAFAVSDRRGRRHSMRIKAGLFMIKQARAKRRAAKRTRIPMEIDLLSPPRAESACVRGPARGVVRTMSMVAKGYVRALGGASTATVRDATFNTTDRCDGTLTEVGRGRVFLAVTGKRNRKRIEVRAGQAYLVRAKLFAARKGRRPQATMRRAVQ